LLAIVQCRIFYLSVCYAKLTNSGTQKYNFVCLFFLHECESCVLIVREERRLGVIDGDMWTYEGRDNRWVEKTTQRGASRVALFIKY